MSFELFRRFFLACCLCWGVLVLAALVGAMVVRKKRHGHLSPLPIGLWILIGLVLTIALGYGTCLGAFVLG